MIHKKREFQLSEYCGIRILYVYMFMGYLRRTTGTGHVVIVPTNALNRIRIACDYYICFCCFYIFFLFFFVSHSDYSNILNLICYKYALADISPNMLTELNKMEKKEKNNKNKAFNIAHIHPQLVTSNSKP